MGGFNSNDYTGLEITSGTNVQPLVVVYKRGTKIVNTITIDSYDANGDPIINGVTFVGTKLNILEGRFESLTKVEIQNNSVVENARINGDHRMIPYFDSDFATINGSGNTLKLNSTPRDVNNTNNFHWLNVATGTTLSAVSTSADDAFPAGTGVTIIFLDGLDANLNIQQEILFITGLTPSVTTSTWRAINNSFVIAGGTNGEGAKGEISVTSTTDGTEWIRYLVGDTGAPVGRYTVPAGQRLLIVNTSFNAGDGGDMSVNINIQQQGGYQFNLGNVFVGGGIVNFTEGTFSTFIEEGFTISFRGFTNSGNPFQRKLSVAMLGAIGPVASWDKYKFTQ